MTRLRTRFGSRSKSRPPRLFLTNCFQTVRTWLPRGRHFSLPSPLRWRGFTNVGTTNSSLSLRRKEDVAQRRGNRTPAYHQRMPGLLVNHESLQMMPSKHHSLDLSWRSAELSVGARLLLPGDIEKPHVVRSHGQSDVGRAVLNDDVWQPLGWSIGGPKVP